MTRLEADVAVLGAGFGGSITSLLLQRSGLRPVLIDRSRHPRFAIGESSTPIADFILKDLAARYDLPALAPLAKFGTWREQRPELVCGLKRGFSYFRHRPGEPFRVDPGHSNELLVAASFDDRRADTHWLRADVDRFFAEQVQAEGIPYFDETDVSIETVDGGWRLDGNRNGEPVGIDAAFLIDATGGAESVLRALGISSTAEGMATCSRAIYGHFEKVAVWQESLAGAGADLSDHPFPCDAAAVHHLLEEGWMWQLRFINGITSAGFVLTGEQAADAGLTAEDEWETLLRRYPSLGEQFAEARLVAPESGLVRTGRMQRRAGQSAGENWAALPNTAGFVGPMHSTGIGHTLCGIERLVPMLAEHWRKPSLGRELQRYQQTLAQELRLIDRLVWGCERTVDQFELFTAYAMLYFAAATTYEDRRLNGRLAPGAAFLCADDERFVTVVERCRIRLLELLAAGPVTAERAAAYFDFVAEAIRSFNIAGLCDRGVRNMYRYTAVPAD
ncbi:Tryptophan halogenase [Maioricimonas rarisocia]|uniref:Tryptophan halogenase n=1 Tax=Maioricimonas rarisocia TaxID=2528026 RepID=A0A517Z4G3_9PLAN|nr:tryptophan 7-halogenase [Maioricimonas rarisocia]QDU37325.1 Tryptophan halogenase [Maioricimonas rarisocia]